VTLPTSGTLDAISIGVEYELSPPFQLSALYRGGANVAIGTVAGTGSYQTAPMTPDPGPIQIPTSGDLEMSHFYGTSDTAGSVTIDGASIGCSQGNFPTGTTNCFVNVNRNGTITHGGGGGFTSNFYGGPTSWVTPNGGALDYSTTYYFVVTNINHTLSGGTSYSPATTGSTGSSCDMSEHIGPGQANSTIFTVEVHLVSDNSLVATFTCDLELDNT